MALNRARVLFEAVERKQRWQAAHPGVAIALHYAPAWHWAAEWTDPDGTIRLVVNYELDLLLDALERDQAADANSAE
jgi:hypothetical protein